MTNFQENKSLILRFYDELDKATGDEINDVLRSYTANDYHWRGMHPFYEQHNAQTQLPMSFGSPFVPHLIRCSDAPTYLWRAKMM